jgi:pyrroloquinoline quinone (PQQ) biosynthesis protein C
MATKTIDRTFVNSLFEDFVYPAAEALMASRFFTDLRAGTLTTKRLQGFSLEHTWFNECLQKGAALRAVKASDDPAAFMGILRGIEAEITHPGMCKKFGLAMGLTEADFENHLPCLEVINFTANIVAAPLIHTHRAASRAGAMCDETIVQRFCTEFAEHLRKPPYSVDEDALEFFDVHAVVDVEHAEHAARDVARLAITERDQEIVRNSVRNEVKLKLAKWNGIYDAYA